MSLLLIDALGTALGLVYLYLEYKANIWLWLVCLLMYVLDLWLYFQSGLYAKFGIAFFSLALVVYGWTRWGKRHASKKDGAAAITHVSRPTVLRCLAGLAAAWAVLFFVLSHFTDSRVPVADALAGALSIVALWMLSHKYAEQWLVWILADVLYSALCFYKGVPFHGALYAFYVSMAVLGYRKWCRLAAAES